MQEIFSPGDISGMRDVNHGYQNIRARDILVHTIAHCPIDPFVILENKARLQEAWDACSPFEELVERAFEIQEFVSDAGQPINDGEIMTEVYTVTYETGILTEDCEKWDDQPNMDKTWANLQMHFTDAQQNMRER